MNEILNHMLLADFVSSSKAKYLQDVQSNDGKAEEWTVVMGNEAGDLDTIASSIAFAWLRTKVLEQPTISLLQMGREDLDLRAENLHALHLAGLSQPKDQLLFVTDLAEFKPFPSSRFALVDHNRLASTFTPAEPPSVVAIVDHHADEGLYTDTAEPRIVSPAGSCASHIASLFDIAELPPELATLLLSAILIDTDGLKPGGKAIDVDRKAAAFLAPKSTLASSLPPVNVLEASSTNSSGPNSLFEIEAIKSLSEELSTMKNDVSHLGPRDLLRRDYKEYEFVLPWHADKPTIRAGLSTVPVRLKQWALDGKLETEGEAWMKERGLHILGVLTAYRGATKGKRKREMAWMVRTDSPPSDGFDFDVLAERLWDGLEKDAILEVKKHKKFAAGTLDNVPGQLRVRVYTQNPQATRKITAPALKAIMEGPL
ncbi:DHH phosphoesterase [Gymnopus androsaceus JB14]|uniref:DHH phosphoesterase n=1 Tax=Gymnopus androsaceus JB14 TaxID=1447944 RepID=A0A6A4HAV2_9AGAR|nr:DHH phosphoesterase [Gymnopus androsaceus JB14]